MDEWSVADVARWASGLVPAAAVEALEANEVDGTAFLTRPFLS